MPAEIKDIGSIYAEATSGSEAARQWLAAWHFYCHAIDDLVDGDVVLNTESMLDLLIQANSLYSMPFYTEHGIRLAPMVAQVTSTYADSVAWEKSDIEWKARIADVIRCCGNDMVLQVAWILGGYPRMRAISLSLREAAYHSQHS